jgi:hypothetical protein
MGCATSSPNEGAGSIAVHGDRNSGHGHGRGRAPARYATTAGEDSERQSTSCSANDVHWQSASSTAPGAARKAAWEAVSAASFESDEELGIHRPAASGPVAHAFDAADDGTRSTASSASSAQEPSPLKQSVSWGFDVLCARAFRGVTADVEQYAPFDADAAGGAEQAARQAPTLDAWCDAVEPPTEY